MFAFVNIIGAKGLVKSAAIIRGKSIEDSVGCHLRPEVVKEKYGAECKDVGV